MKSQKIICAVILAAAFTLPPATSKADFAIIGVDGTIGANRIALMAVNDIATGSRIWLTDRGFGGINFQPPFDPGDGKFSFTFGSTFSSGSILVLRNVDTAGKSAIDGFGAGVSGSFSSDSGFSFDPSGDQLYVYTSESGTLGDTVTRQLSSIQTTGAGAPLFTNSPAVNREVPSGSAALPQIYYGGSMTGELSIADYVGKIDTENWLTSAAGGGGAGSGFPFSSGRFDVSAVPEPTSLLMVALAGSGGLVLARRRKNRVTNATVPAV